MLHDSRLALIEVRLVAFKYVYTCGLEADCSIILLPPVIRADQGYVAQEEMREYYDLRESSIKYI